MSAPKWTAGPWFCIPSCPSEGYDCFWIQTDDQYIVATADGCQSNSIREANAHLIAAAPDQNEALEESVRLIDDLMRIYAPQEFDTADVTATWERMIKAGGTLLRIAETQRKNRAALAKARGES